MDCVEVKTRNSLRNLRLLGAEGGTSLPFSASRVNIALQQKPAIEASMQSRRTLLNLNFVDRKRTHKNSGSQFVATKSLKGGKQTEGM